MSDASFVRTEMLAERNPPSTSVGAVGWLRANLFSNWWNAILTALCLAAIWYVLAGLLGWTFLSVWSADSLNECREMMISTWGGTHGHACWGVINDRWLQLLFGFYPPELYHRPILALVLLFVALAPVLFADKVWRGLLAVTAAYPFLMPWLMWGGSVWMPAGVAAGFVLAYLVGRNLGGKVQGLFLGSLCAVLWWMLWLGLPFQAAASGEGLGGILAAGLGEGLASISPDAAPFWLETVESRKFGGFMLSVLIGVVAIGCSLPLGILLALGRQSDMLIVKAICVGFIEFIRGVPLITLLFVASTLLNIFLPPGTDFDIILRVMIMVTLFAAAYMAEVIRGGLAGLPKGQHEGADSLGLDYWQAQRLIIMPQALKISIPGIVSTFIGVFKDTTLVSIIALLDPVGLSNSIRADTDWNGIYWELFAFIALMFFIVCFGMSRYATYLERKLKTEND